MVDHHIDDFINIGRHRWDVSYFIFYGDPIYDMQSSFQMKNDDVLLSYDLVIKKIDDDMIADSFSPLGDSLLQSTHDDVHSCLRICDACPFEHSYWLYDEYFPSSLHSNFDEHETLVTLEQSKTHTIEQQYFCPGDSCMDL